MPEFLNEAWFWTGLYGVLGSTLTLLVTGVMRRKRELNLERVRLYDADILAAHKRLYVFASTSILQFSPPENPQADFAFIMKENYFKSVKPDLLMFSSEIRAILHNFEVQYHCLGDEELTPEILFETFVDNHLYKDLAKIERLVEKRVDANLGTLR